MVQKQRVTFRAKVPTKRRVSFIANRKRVPFVPRVRLKKRVSFIARGEAKKCNSSLVPRGSTHRAGSALGIDVSRSLVASESAISILADILTLFSVLGILGSLGINLIGFLAASVYLIGWEIIGHLFASVERRLPRPVRRLWRIGEGLVSIVFG